MGTTDRVHTDERADLLETLGQHRQLLRRTLRDLTDEQAAQRTTVSELCLGGLIKHVTSVERVWAEFIRRGPTAFDTLGADPAAWAANFRMLPGETLAGLLAAYESACRDTDLLIADLTDLDLSHPLPDMPWFAPGTHWSARRVVLHLIAETSQHAGHADILRESLDGAKTMC